MRRKREKRPGQARFTLQIGGSLFIAKFEWLEDFFNTSTIPIGKGGCVGQLRSVTWLSSITNAREHPCPIWLASF
ncbi:MAG: hypothetical protein R6V12_18845 [Candidatus Hydrogenedentota bacterium]